MTRPLRLEFPGAVYHVTARGDGREPIFLDDEDRQSFLDRLGREVMQQGWRLRVAWGQFFTLHHLFLYPPPMARPLRLEFPGAVYHVTARGDRREPIFLDDEDRQSFLDRLGREVMQQSWRLYAFCLMGNHYHLLMETPEANLSRGMRRLNGAYTQAFNRRHRRVGHVLQGRYKAILVDRDAYLLELCRYIVLNPVRAGLVEDPVKWAWSSYAATAGNAPVPEWLAANVVLGLFQSDAAAARHSYVRFVAEGIGRPSPWQNLAGQIFLGDPAFLQRMQARAAQRPAANVPRAQRAPARPSPEHILRAVGDAYGVAAEQVLHRSNGRAFRLAVYLLRRVGNLPLAEVAKLAGVSPSRVSQIQAELEATEHDQRMTAVLATIT